MFFPMCGIPLTDDRRRRFSRLFRDAIQDEHLTLDQAAREADRDVRQFARQIDGEVGAIRALMQQTDAWWSSLGERILMEFGLSERSRQALVARRVTATRKQQLKVEKAS